MMNSTSKSNISGVVLIDKPSGISSANVDYKIKKHISNLLKIPIRKSLKVGHAGTLDPFASGELLVGIGNATKELNEFENSDKIYEATIKFGFSTTTDDLEGDIISKKTDFKMSKEEIKNALEEFQGKQMQKPPLISAKRINGERAYNLVRNNREDEVENNLKACEIEIFKIELIDEEKLPENIDSKNCEIKIRVDCSKGTFIRAIARDLGEKLEVPAHLSALKRTKYISDNKINLKKISLDDFLKIESLEELEEKISRFANGTSLIFGRFDGVHLGHEAMIEKLKMVSQSTKTKSVALIIDDSSEKPLLTIEQRKQRILNFGIKEVEVIKLESIMEIESTDFINMLVEKYNCENVIITKEMRFGKNREGDWKTFENESRVKSYFVDLIEENLEKVSSTKIRQALLKGQINAANSMLGVQFKCEGEVVHGFARGRKIGFPTANLANIKTLIPQVGVYFGYAVWSDFRNKRREKCIISIGNNPTFDGQEQTVEAHIIGDNSLELYEKKLQLAFIEKIREMIKFESVDELCEQLKKDTIFAQSYEM